MKQFFHDIRKAYQNVLRAPRFTIPVLLVLALGIGATTAVFGVLRTILLTPAPYPEPERVVSIWREYKTSPGSGTPASWPEYMDYQGRFIALEYVAGFWAESMNLTGVDTPVQVSVGQITPDYFRIFRVQPVLGTLQWEKNTERGAILSGAFWRRQMGGDPSILGRSILLNGVAHPVLGVLPEQLDLSGCEVFIPLVPTEQQKKNRGNHFLPLRGLLRAGVSSEQAKAELDAFNEAQSQELSADVNSRTHFIVKSLMDIRRDNQKDVARILTLVAGLVFLIALVNLSGQFLVRALGRMGDSAIRLSLGANLVQTLRPGLMEALVLAVVGALLGLVVAAGSMALLRPVILNSLLANSPLELDWGMLVFSLLLCIVVSVLVSILPGLVSLRISPVHVLKEGGRSIVSGHARWLRTTLVVLQMALALALLGSFGVLVKNLIGLYRVPLGLRSSGVAVFQCRAGFTNLKEREASAAKVQRVIERLQGMAGVQNAGTISPMLPIQEHGSNTSLHLRERKLPAEVWFERRYVSSDIFRALGVDLLKGRFFERGDYLPSSQSVVILSESAAHYCWPDQDPIGKEISNDGTWWWRVVGVVADVRHAGPVSDRANKSIYTPGLVDDRCMSFVVRFDSAKHVDLAALRHVMSQEAPEWPVAKLQTMDDVVDQSVQRRTILVKLLGLASFLALALALVGVQGVLGYQVSRRTRELGIRIAMGATRVQVSWLVLQEGLKLASAGVFLGLGGAFAGARIVASQFRDSGSLQPMVLLAAIAVLFTGAIIASLQPALRAARIQPAEALRNE